MDIIVIGDTEDDILAGELCGAITTYRFVPWGDVNNIQTKATHVINDLRKVLQELK